MVELNKYIIYYERKLILIYLIKKYKNIYINKYVMKNK